MSRVGGGRASFIYFMLIYIRTRIFIYLFIVSLRITRTLNSVVAGFDHNHSALTFVSTRSRPGVYLHTDALNPWRPRAT